MKKFLLFGLALLILGSALFADDAKVMPGRLGRFYLAPTFITINKAYDDEGSREDLDAAINMFNLGAALEYGIIDWITGALQWAPGINVWSKVDVDSGDAKLFDVGDLFLGFKVQLFGASAPVKAEKIRFALAPGVKIPMPGPDFKKEAKNMGEGKAFTGGTLDNHSLGVGARAYFDFIINDKFFINLYNETLFYPIKKDIKKAGVKEYMTLEGVNAAIAPAGSSVKGEVDYGYELTFELEPVFSTPVAEGMLFTAGLPVNYKTTPGAKYSFSGSGPAGDAGVTNMKGLLPDGDQTHSLTLTPNAAMFFYGWPLPMEFKLSYTAPLWGQNTSAGHVIGFQVRLYFKI